MAGFASRRRAIGAHLQHPFLELPFVRIGVTTRTIQTLPVIDHGLRLEFFRFLVALRARHRHMAAREKEMGFFMFGQGEGGGLVAFQVVAATAGVEIRSSGELIRVPVAMAIGAALELDLEQRVFASGNVTLRAFQAGMAALQRICRSSVLRYCE